jgi:hypothetical protein
MESIVSLQTLLNENDCVGENTEKAMLVFYKPYCIGLIEFPINFYEVRINESGVSMSSLYLLVQDILHAGYLSLEDEVQLKELATRKTAKTALDDEDALLFLKQAIAFGHVKREQSSIHLSEITIGK